METLKYSKEKLIEQMDLGESVEFLFFWGHKENSEHVTRACLSQWFPCKFEVDGVEYNCAEQYMMAEKARVFGDDETLGEIMHSSEQKEIKALGRKVKDFNPTKWDAVKRDIIVKGNMAKFSQNSRLERFLKWTGNKILVEASPYDKIWGIGLKSSDPDALDPHNWKGLNLLGFALMEVRDQINAMNSK